VAQKIKIKQDFEERMKMSEKVHQIDLPGTVETLFTMQQGEK